MTREPPQNPPRPPRQIPLPEDEPARTPRAPRAFDLGGEAEAAGRTGAKIAIEETPDPQFDAPEAERAASVAPPAPLFTFGTLFSAALSLLVTLYLADIAWNFVQSLAAKSPLLADAALVLIGLVVFGIAVFLAREALALLRMRKVARLRVRAQALLGSTDADGVRALIGALCEFYAADATTAGARREVSRALGELHDPKSLLAIAERELLKPKDDAARRAIALAAQRVSVVTALSPRAIVDVAFVLTQSMALIRTLSALYGGRASGIGLFRLAARVASHLALTGGMAMADSLVSQFLGAGLAARLSAKLGEGVLNGILTARVGIAAIALSRPVPFVECPPVILSEVVEKSVFLQRVAENPAGRP